MLRKKLKVQPLILSEVWPRSPTILPNSRWVLFTTQNLIGSKFQPQEWSHVGITLINLLPSFQKTRETFEYAELTFIYFCWKFLKLAETSWQIFFCGFHEICGKVTLLKGKHRKTFLKGKHSFLWREYLPRFERGL